MEGIKSAIGRLLLQVFAKVINYLKAHGYAESENLFAAPYDWRLNMAMLEERDGYFSSLKTLVEQASVANAGNSTCAHLFCR